MTGGKILYSCDGSGKNLAKENKKEEAYHQVIPSETCLKLRIEKKGRGGKEVTIIDDLPRNPPFFKSLLKNLKNHIGTGGSFKDNTIEIQGDHRSKLRTFLEKRGFKVKGPA